MARSCSACVHSQTESISVELIQGTPIREIAKKYDLSASAVARHKKHLPQHLIQVEGAQVQPGSVMARVQELEARADRIYQEAMQSKKQELALRALKELREVTSLYARLAGELETQSIHQHIHISPEWLSLRSVMLRALQPYPDARKALVEAIEGHSGGV